MNNVLRKFKDFYNENKNELIKQKLHHKQYESVNDDCLCQCY